MSDDFVKSMTFASVGDELRLSGALCDCDECDNNTNISEALRNAIQQRKRRRIETGPIKRTQQRTFINRQHVVADGAAAATGGGIISVYNVTMPLNAEPLVEFGNSHRLIWIKRLGGSSSCPLSNSYSTKSSSSPSSLLSKKKNVFQSVGQGIIGSSDEERSRMTLWDWTQDKIILVPSTEGKAAGWIHTIQQHPQTSPPSNDKGMVNSPKTSSSNGETIARSSTTESSSYAHDNDGDQNTGDATGSNSSNSSNSSNAYAVMYIAKIPKSLIVDNVDGGSGSKNDLSRDKQQENQNPTDTTIHSNDSNNKNDFDDGTIVEDQASQLKINTTDDDDWARKMLKCCRIGLSSLSPLTTDTATSTTSNPEQTTTKTTMTSNSSSSKADNNQFYEFDTTVSHILRSAFVQSEKESSNLS